MTPRHDWMSRDTLSPSVEKTFPLQTQPGPSSCIQVRALRGVRHLCALELPLQVTSVTAAGWLQPRMNLLELL